MPYGWLDACHDPFCLKYYDATFMCLNKNLHHTVDTGVIILTAVKVHRVCFFFFFFSHPLFLFLYFFSLRTEKAKHTCITFKHRSLSENWIQN